MEIWRIKKRKFQTPGGFSTYLESWEKTPWHPLPGRSSSKPLIALILEAMKGKRSFPIWIIFTQKEVEELANIARPFVNFTNSMDTAFWILNRICKGHEEGDDPFGWNARETIHAVCMEDDPLVGGPELGDDQPRLGIQLGLVLGGT